MAQIQQDALRRTGSGRPDLLQRVLLDPIRDVGDDDSGVGNEVGDVGGVVFNPIVSNNDHEFKVAQLMTDVNAEHDDLSSQPTQFVYLRDVGLLCLVGVVAGALFGFVAGLSVFP
tara:strand:+ start:30 stop:374 length:345 start_codon:yes stop_codon:yes gene_type:complete